MTREEGEIMAHAGPMTKYLMMEGSDGKSAETSLRGQEDWNSRRGQTPH